MSKPIISFWKATHNSELSSLLTQCDLEVQDVLIIGAGISGFSTAYFLNRFNPNLKICILEKREKIAHGATGNNGGHIWPGLCDSFAATCAKYGKQQAKALYEFTLATTQEIEKFCKQAKHGSNVEFERTGSVALATTEEEWNKIQKEYEALKECEIPFVELLTKEQCAEISGYNGTLYGGMLTKSAGQLFPARLVYALSAELPAATCKIVTGCHVTSVKYDKEQDLYIITSQDGAIRMARNVVHATNAWASDILPELKAIIVPVRGQVLATEPLQDIQFPHGLLLNEGYEYLIQRRADKRVVLGGYRWLSKNNMERNVTDDSTINEDVSKGLRQFISEHVGAQVKIDFEWSGIMGFSADCNPLVGKFKEPREYILAGYTGHGMPLAFLCGKLVAQTIATSNEEPLITVPELLKANRFNSK